MTGSDIDFLIAAAIEGDDRATAELVRRTEPRVRQLCRILGSGDSEDDLVQETYLRALPALASFRGEAPLATWLASIARHVCADDVRRRQRERRLLDRLRPTVEVNELPPDVTRYLLDELDPDRREAFVLTQVAGYGYADAAAIVGCPIGTIRSRVARARGDLIELIQRGAGTGSTARTTGTP